jgi:ribokinase
MSAPKADGGGARIISVVVVGSLHYDILVDASDRPRKGETVAGHAWSPKFGGKGGNQSLAAQSQGVPTAMVGAVGNDDFGTALLTGLDRGGVDRSAVATVQGVGSGMSVAIFDAEGDYGAVIVSGSNLSIKPTQAHDELLRSARVLILQNEIPEAVNEDVARRARQFGVKTILNAAPARTFELLLALVQANETRPAQQDASRLSDADAIVMAELTRRLGQRASCPLFRKPNIKWRCAWISIPSCCAALPN